MSIISETSDVSFVPYLHGETAVYNAELIVYFNLSNVVYVFFLIFICLA